MGRQERKGPDTSRQPPSQNPADAGIPATPGPDRLITAAPGDSGAGPLTRIS